MNPHAHSLKFNELRGQTNRRETSLRAGHIVEIGFLIVAFKGNRDNNGLFRLVMNSLVFWMVLGTPDAQVAEKMAAMSMQMGRIKPADSTKRRQVSTDGTDGRTKTFCSSYSIIIGEVKAVSGGRFWLDSGLDSGADSVVDFVRKSL
ncbi:hypothetical protein C8J57DRAFT_1241794 [Mycena rebaudengoi]|nr:hypothetical protein C8J57DRAFT_1241794 [Mycena rebaudengoi]